MTFTHRLPSCPCKDLSSEPSRSPDIVKAWLRLLKQFAEEKFG